MQPPTYTRMHAHTSVARVRWQGERNADSSRRDRDLHTVEEDRWRGEGGWRTSFRVPAAHKRATAPPHTQLDHEHERDPCLTRLASVSSELSTGPVVSPCVPRFLAPFCHPIVRTCVRASVLSTCA